MFYLTVNHNINPKIQHVYVKSDTEPSWLFRGKEETV